MEYESIHIPFGLILYGELVDGGPRDRRDMSVIRIVVHFRLVDEFNRLGGSHSALPT